MFLWHEVETTGGIKLRVFGKIPLEHFLSSGGSVTLTLSSDTEPKLDEWVVLYLNGENSTVRGKWCLDIAMLFIRPKFHRKGIGSAVLDLCKSIAHASNIDAVVVSLTTQGEHTVEFLVKNGFSFVRDDYAYFVTTKSGKPPKWLVATLVEREI